MSDEQAVKNEESEMVFSDKLNTSIEDPIVSLRRKISEVSEGFQVINQRLAALHKKVEERRKNKQVINNNNNSQINDTTMISNFNNKTECSSLDSDNSPTVSMAQIDVVQTTQQAKTEECSSFDSNILPTVSMAQIDVLQTTQQAKTEECSSSDSNSSPTVSMKQIATNKTIQQIQPFDERYEFKHMLGEGAFGRVYRAHDTSTMNDVIVKCLKETPCEVPMEVLVMKKLKHRYINELLSYQIQNDEFRIIMKCHGQKSKSLQEYWAKTPYNSISEKVLSYLFKQIFTGVAYLHSKDVAHMDLKPENIIINDAFQIKIIDFGLARQIRDPDFDDEPYYDPFGTISFMSPEQCYNNGFYGPECDVWALGVSLYNLFTGKFPCHNRRGRFIVIPQLYRRFKRRCSREMLELLNGLFCKQPKNRITALEASKHNWCNKTFDTKMFDLHHVKAFCC